MVICHGGCVLPPLSEKYSSENHLCEDLRGPLCSCPSCGFSRGIWLVTGGRRMLSQRWAFDSLHSLCSPYANSQLRCEESTSHTWKLWSSLAQGVVRTTGLDGNKPDKFVEVGSINGYWTLYPRLNKCRSSVPLNIRSWSYTTEGSYHLHALLVSFPEGSWQLNGGLSWPLSDSVRQLLGLWNASSKSWNCEVVASKSGKRLHMPAINTEDVMVVSGEIGKWLLVIFAKWSKCNTTGIAILSSDHLGPPSSFLRSRLIDFWTSPEAG